MAYFVEIMKWVEKHPYLATTITIGGLAGVTAIGWKAMDSLKEFGKNGTSLCTMNIHPATVTPELAASDC